MQGVDPVVLIAGGAAFVLVFLCSILWVQTRYRRAGPNEALVVYGRGPTRVVVAGGVFVWPFFMEAKRLSLEPMAADLTVEERVGAGAAALRAEVRARFALSRSPERLQAAAQRFLDSPPEVIAETGRAMLEAHVRAALRALGPEAAAQPARLAEQARAGAAQDLSALGMDLLLLDAVSVTAQ